MNLLLDTHVVLWWLGGQPLATEAMELVADTDNTAYVSAASMWEVAIKASLGKLHLAVAMADFEAAIAADFHPLPITWGHAMAAGNLPPHHRDPFDRMLVAQAREDGLALVTGDATLSAYDVHIVPARA